MIDSWNQGSLSCMPSSSGSCAGVPAAALFWFAGAVPGLLGTSSSSESSGKPYLQGISHIKSRLLKACKHSCLPSHTLKILRTLDDMEHLRAEFQHCQRIVQLISSSYLAQV